MRARLGGRLNVVAAGRVTSLFACSRVYAEMRFRRATGQSILEAIQAVRLERAKELLRNPNRQIKAIADFCGLKSATALCKFFRSKTGVTMSAWRANANAAPGVWTNSVR